MNKETEVEEILAKLGGKFRKKPVVVEAILYNGENYHEVYLWAELLSGSDSPGLYYGVTDGLFINTLEGPMHVSEGDWVIRGTQGEFYPCKPDSFSDTFEEVV